MKTKQLFFLFIAVAVVQAAVPLKMIYDSEMTKKHGTEYKFKTVPIDPTDPFRGKYITLNYDITSFPTRDTTWTGGDRIYVSLEKDDSGFAKIAAVAREEPESGSDYIAADVAFNYGGRIVLEFPFDRFYMAEGKAAEAEKSYGEYSRKDNARPAYAVIAVKDGTAVVKDVIVDGMPIREYVLKERENKKQAR